jgi:hypothetical protein
LSDLYPGDVPGRRWLADSGYAAIRHQCSSQHSGSVRHRQEADRAGGGATCESRRGPVQVNLGHRVGRHFNRPSFHGEILCCWRPRRIAGSEGSPLHAYTWYVRRKTPRSGPSLKTRVACFDTRATRGCCRAKMTQRTAQRADAGRSPTACRTSPFDRLRSLMGQGAGLIRISTPWDACVLCALAGA